MIALLVADRLYLRFFQDLPSLGSAVGFGQVDQLGASVLSPRRTWRCRVSRGGAAGCAGMYSGGEDALEAAPLRKRLAVAALTLAFVLATLSLVGRTAAVRQVFRRTFVARETGVIGAHFIDAGDWVGRRLIRRGLASSELDRVERWFRDRQAGRPLRKNLFAVAQGLNLLMIQAESLQAFVPGLSVAGQEVTPTLNRWIGESIVFDRVTDQTGHGRSSDAELLTQVSLLPLADGAAAFAAAGNRYTSLAGELAERGYFTLSAVPFDRTFWNRGVTHPSYGYSHSLFVEDFSPGEMVGWGLGDREFFGQMGRRLAELPAPFCAWLITLSLHHPFDGFPAATRGDGRRSLARHASRRLPAHDAVLRQRAGGSGRAARVVRPDGLDGDRHLGRPRCRVRLDSRGRCLDGSHAGRRRLVCQPAGAVDHPPSRRRRSLS